MEVLRLLSAVPPLFRAWAAGMRASVVVASAFVASAVTASAVGLSGRGSQSPEHGLSSCGAQVWLLLHVRDLARD